MKAEVIIDFFPYLMNKLETLSTSEVAMDTSK